MSRTLRAAVLLSAGRHPETAAPRACRGDAVALALGRRLIGDGLAALHAGAASEPALADYLALGAGSIEVLTVAPGRDVLGCLVERLRGMDLILTGSRAELGPGSGLLPYALAHALGRPIVANVLEARVEAQDVYIRQFLPKGKRRRISAPLPVVLSVHPLAPAEMRYAHARKVAGRILELTHENSALEFDGGQAWTAEAAARRPRPLKAEEKKAAHARLTSAIVSESKGGIVAIEGSSVDKAQVMLSFLREHRLVDF
jgi:electron transfer flavoprotein beta subunit